MTWDLPCNPLTTWPVCLTSKASIAYKLTRNPLAMVNENKESDWTGEQPNTDALISMNIGKKKTNCFLRDRLCHVII